MLEFGSPQSLLQVSAHHLHNDTVHAYQKMIGRNISVPEMDYIAFNKRNDKHIRNEKL